MLQFVLRTDQKCCMWDVVSHVVLLETMTMTMTRLIEDVSNNSVSEVDNTGRSLPKFQASPTTRSERTLSLPASGSGVSRLTLWAWVMGVMTPRRKHRESGKVMSAVGSKKNLKRHWDDNVSRCVQSSQTGKEGCDKFGSVSTGSRTHVKPGTNKTDVSEALHTGREPESHVSWSYPVASHEYRYTTYSRGRGIFLRPRFPVKGLDVLALNSAWTLAAAGDVAVVGCRRWRDVQVICCCGVVQCWVLQSSITCFAYCLSFFFPTRRHVFRSNKPCITVCQIITFNSLGFFIFYKLIQVVFPSLCWYSCFSLSSCRDDKSWVPLGSSSGPSFCLCVQSARLGAISVFSVSLPNLWCCTSTFSQQLLLRFFSSTPSNLLTPLLAWCAFLYLSEMKYCYPGHIPHSSFVLSTFPDSYVASLIERLFLPSLFCFLCLQFLFVWMMRRSTLRCVVRIIISCSFVVVHVPAPYLIAGVTTASKRCNLCRSK